MDRRSWPWKKKMSEKNLTENPIAASDTPPTSLSSAASLGSQDYKKVNYVQISLDSYKHLNGMEDKINILEDQVLALEHQVQDLTEKLGDSHSEIGTKDDLVGTLQNQVSTLECQVKDLKGKLSAAHLEISTKDDLVKQHAKVAEEAVSGWEKADAEAHGLKNQLESVTLLKLTAENRASHLDGALKECMRQIRNVKEENELKFQEIVLSKTKQWDKLKLDFEAKLVELDGALLQATAEKAALSRSLQEQLNIITSINGEKSQAEAEVELLKGNIQLYEKEISSLKYELHVVSKELDIRNQENNMSFKTTEAANKQHLEDVKKIAKLEAECQRLRGLVRKKLPGPAALARMKLEVESLDQNFSEPLSRRNAVKNPNYRSSSKMEFSSDNLKRCQNESEIHGRFMEMEEEMKTLKEALATRDMELQTSRNMCTKTLFKVKSLETQIQVLNQQTGSSSLRMHAEVFPNQIECTPPSVTSISEDGIDEEGSSTESWGPLISDVSQLWRDKSIEKSAKPSSADHMELMDDFLEMEKMAHSSNESKFSSPNGSTRNITSKLGAAVSQIHQFVLSLGREACQIQEISASEIYFNKMLKDFTASVEKFSGNKLSLGDLFLELSNILVKAGKLSSGGAGYKNYGGDSIDKLPLVEKRPIQDESFVSTASNECDTITHQSSDGLHDGNLNSGFSSGVASCKCILQKGKHLISEKVVVVAEVPSSIDDLENVKLQLQETEQLLVAVKSQLESSEKCHSLAEIQLKCMTESYKLLEMKANNLETEVKVLQEKIEKLEKELVEEKNHHHDTLATLEELQQKIQRDVKCSVCLSSTAVDNDFKTKQEKEIAAATEKLAECQATIHLLSRQLQALRPCTETKDSDFDNFKPKAAV